MAEKVYIVVIKANLDCHRCRKEIRKILCKFPGIRSQVFDDKENTVTVTGNFDPERLECKLRCRVGKSITSIEIKEPEKKKDKPPAEKGGDKPKKEKDEPPPPKVPEPAPPAIPWAPTAIPWAPPEACCSLCYEGHDGHYCANRFFSEEGGYCRTM